MELEVTWLTRLGEKTKIVLQVGTGCARLPLMAIDNLAEPFAGAMFLNKLRGCPSTSVPSLVP